MNDAQKITLELAREKANFCRKHKTTRDYNRPEYAYYQGMQSIADIWVPPYDKIANMSVKNEIRFLFNDYQEG